MRNDRFFLLLNASIGGFLSGMALLQEGFFLMPIGIAFLWASRRSLEAGFVWGLIAVLVSHQWLLSLHPLTGVEIPSLFSLPLVLLIWFFCASFGGLLVASWCWFSNLSWLNPISTLRGQERFYFVLALSCLWGVGEGLLAYSPLFWIGVGSSVLPNDFILAQLARWIGVSGLASLQLLIGWWLWKVVIAFRNGLGVRKILSLGLLILLILHGTGIYLLISLETPSENLSVAIWQTNIPIKQRFTNFSQDKFLEKVDESLIAAKEFSADLMVAPEGTIASNQSLNSPTLVPFLVGGFRRVRGELRNSLLVFNKGEQRFSKALDKHRVVPLGEWIPKPFGTLFGGLSAVGQIFPGESSRLLDWIGNNVAISICYELTQGHAISNAARQGAEWILAISNLDPYPQSLQNQYIIMAQLRSIESNRDLIAVSNTGPSGLVLASGEIQTLFSPFEENIGLVKLHLNSINTLYSRWREFPLIMIFICSLIGILNSRSLKVN